MSLNKSARKKRIFLSDLGYFYKEELSIDLLKKLFRAYHERFGKEAGS